MRAPAAGHPPVADLAAYALGKLDFPAAETVNDHLAGCLDCRTVVETTTNDPLLDLLRQPPGDTPAPAATPLTGTQRVSNPSFDESELPPELRDHPRYRIVRKLGQGGMGAVYQAEHKIMERVVAVKVISSGFVDSPAAAERFQREVRAAAKLDHANIVRAYDADHAGRTMLLAMEFVKGRSLAEAVASKGPLPVAYACNCIRQAAQGLQHAADSGMVHRDIKPQNLMLTDKGVVKICDFGLAKLVSERKSQAGLTGAGMIMGTPEYMAPEQARDTAAADIRADIYALGCTLFFLLTGRTPFGGGTAIEILTRQVMDAPPRVTDLRPEVPSHLADLIGRMLSKDPAERPQTPKEVATALGPLTKRATPTAPDVELATSAAALQPPAARRPRGLVLVTVAAAALVAGVLLAGIVLTLKTKDGIVTLAVDPPDAKVEVAEGSITVRPRGDNEPYTIKVAEGGGKLRISKAGFEVTSKEVTLSDKGQRLTVTLTPSKPPPPRLPTQAAAAAAFVPLFNGKDLTGWIVDGGDPNAWEVADGELVARAPEQYVSATNGYLLTERNYSDFVLRCQFRQAADTATSGIALRAVPLETARDSMPDQKTDHPYHLTVWIGKYIGDLQKEGTGALWWSPQPGRVPPLIADRPAEIRPLGQWNDMEVEMRGHSLRVVVNGREIQNVMLNKTRPESFPARGLGRDAGRVGLLKHTDEIRFRNIEIKDLSANAGGAAASATPETPAQLLPEKSEWAGVGIYDRIGKQQPSAATVTITKRDGSEFTADVRSNAFRVTIEGSIRQDGEYTFKVVPAKDAAGGSNNVTGNGKVEKNQMTFAWINPDGPRSGRYDLKRLPDAGVGFDFAGGWLCVGTSSNWQGTRTVRSNGTFADWNGKEYKWSRDGGLIHAEWSNGHEWLAIDPDNPNELNGYSTWGSGEGRRWTRRNAGIPDGAIQPPPATPSGAEQPAAAPPPSEEKKTEPAAPVAIPATADLDRVEASLKKLVYARHPARNKTRGQALDELKATKAAIKAGKPDAEVRACLDRLQKNVNDLRDVAANPANRTALEDAERYLDGVIRSYRVKEASPPAAAVLAPEKSEWAGTGVFKNAKGEWTSCGAWTFTERRGQTFKALWRGGSWKAIIEGVIDVDGRITLEAREFLSPAAKPREPTKGSGVVGSEWMTVLAEDPKSSATNRVVFKRLPDGGARFNFQGRWKCFHQPNGWSDFRTIKGDAVFSSRGTKDGPWERDGGLIITHYPGGGHEWLIIDPDKPNELHGTNGPQSVTWIRH
jgi:tRNA A-37 threonylcarbamoyl transferase component Bud32